MILLFTDFGQDGPYVGEMKAVLAGLAPGVAAVDIQHDAPVWNPKAAAYLLAALARRSAPGDIWLAVVDPGVGGARPPVVVDCDGIRFVGPDNGLFEIVRRRASVAAKREIVWRPEVLSASFHGRDLFAPVAARLALGEAVALGSRSDGSDGPGADWPDQLAAIVYTDGFGNLMTGLDGDAAPPDRILHAGGADLRHAATFSAVPEGAAFWYVNSAGLVEIAANRARADVLLGLGNGDRVAFNS